MKKVFLLTVFLSVVLICAAPELSLACKDDSRISIMNELARIRWEKEFTRYAENLRMKESPCSTAINPLGCMGWFQFHPSTLRELGYGQITVTRFRAHPEIFPESMQLEALKKLITKNELALKHYLHYSGLVIGGITITRSGMLAASHLGGAGAVRLFLNSNGEKDLQDRNGTRISDYLREFQGYDI